MNEFLNDPQANMDPITQTTTLNDSNKYNSKYLAVLIGIVVLIVILAGVGSFYFISTTNPTNVYRNLLKKGINGIYDLVYLDEDKINASLELGVNLKLEEELLDEETLSLINDTKLAFNFQMDRVNKKLIAKLDSDYAKESLLDLQVFVDAKKENSYLYAKDFFDKYLELEVSDYSSINQFFEETDLTGSQKSNFEKAKKILTKELTNVITSKDCYKEDGYYILKITTEELSERLEKAVENLKNNDEFLSCFEDKDMVESSLEGFYIDSTSYEDEELKISLKKTFFTNEITEVIIETENEKITFEEDDDKFEYKMLSNKEEILSGTIKVEKDKEIANVDLSLEVPNFGEIEIDINTQYITGKDIDSVNTSSAVSIDELTEEDQTEIMTNIENSQLYEIISLFLGDLDTGNDDYYDEDYDNGYDDYYDSEYEDNSYDNNSNNINTNAYSINSYDNSTTVSLNIPDGYEISYNSDTYKTFKNDSDVELTYMMSYYDNENEYLTGLNSKPTYYTGDYYSNVDLSESKSTIVNGRTYYYKDFTYTYVGYSITTPYYEKYLCTKIEDDYYLIIEISSPNYEISDSVLNTILSISK